MRVIITGPPSSCKTTLSKAVAEHFKIPHLELGQDIESMQGQLSSNVCRYRGYVLDADTIGFDEAEKLFRFDVEVTRNEEDEEPPPPADGEEAAPAPKQFERRLNEEITPSFAIVTQSPDAVCRARWQASGGKDEADFDRRLAKYSMTNLKADQHCLSDFFMDIANVGILNLPVAGQDEEDLFESVRIYMERSGRPFNYLPTEEEVAAEVRAKHEEKVKAAIEAAAKTAEEAAKGAGDDGEKKLERLNAERLKIIAEHEKAQAELQELPLREYLMRHTVPALTEGLIEMCKVLPENPVDYLATYLEQHAAAKK
eukprot:TRINITY_DN5485_c1_g2_i3.p2 TRINITY_DN5485_c1_g2~~TRINITY_DN5485_c1_g2_i3.p2  ORF type:complete len:313 (+),score=92.65 TRINITY_DN5485_c1_g2_i3:1137-2075(+)